MAIGPGACRRHRTNISISATTIFDYDRLAKIAPELIRQDARHAIRATAGKGTMAVMGLSGQAANDGCAASAMTAPMMQARRRIFLSYPARLVRALLMGR
jgi:hypothetical protein